MTQILVQEWQLTQHQVKVNPIISTYPMLFLLLLFLMALKSHKILHKEIADYAEQGHKVYP